MPPSKRGAAESQIIDYWWFRRRARYCVSWVWKSECVEISGIPRLRMLTNCIHVDKFRLSEVLLPPLRLCGSMHLGINPRGMHHMITALRTNYPDFVALRTMADLDRYEIAVEKFAAGGGRIELMSALVRLGIPAGQIRTIAAHPGQRLPAVCAG